LEKAIDIGYLNNLLNELEIKINDLTQSQTKKYTSKQQKIDLEVIFFKNNQIFLLTNKNYYLRKFYLKRFN
jgi:hypothetical protein